jgi:regulatory protein YycI of two-component signal transduction system YycFG
MNNVQKFFSKNGYIIICIFLGLILIQMCSQKSTNKSIKKEINIIRKTDSINNNNIIKSLKIEGLKSEKRMIQATDRKILDVQRQNEIEKEINKIENEK